MEVPIHIQIGLNQNKLAPITTMVLLSKIQGLNYGARLLGLPKSIYYVIRTTVSP